METVRKYGWRPDVPDQRDLPFRATPGKLLPPRVDLRAQYKPILDQGSLGSCTANALRMAYDFGRVKQKLTPTEPSRLFIYYNERTLMGTVESDSGAYIRDGIKSMVKWGVCEETLWPYDIPKFTVKPSKAAYTDAIKSPIKQYLRLNNLVLSQLKQCLAEGFGFVFGFSVYETFESPEVARTGIVPMPNTNESLLGGHAVFCVGYDESKQQFIVRNSWGPKWGDKGHFYIPYSYLTNSNLAADFWTIRLV